MSGAKKNVTAEKARIIEIGKESPIAFVFLSGLGIFFLDKLNRASFLRVFYRAISRGDFSLLSFMSPYCCQSFSGNLRIAYLARAFKTLANRSHFSNKRQKKQALEKNIPEGPHFLN